MLSHQRLDSTTEPNMKTYVIAESLQRMDDENDGVHATVDGIRARDRKTWHLCLDFRADCQTRRPTGVFGFVC